MIPRNLRKPTPLRVHFWWNDFARSWRAIGHAVWVEAELVRDAIEAALTDPRETLKTGRDIADWFARLPR